MLARPRPRPGGTPLPGSGEPSGLLTPGPCGLPGRGKEKKLQLDKQMFETILQEVRGFTDEELYDQLSSWQEHPEFLARQQQTEQQLRNEVAKLQEEVDHHRSIAAEAQQKAVEAQASQAEALRRNDFRLSLVKRQLQSIKRGTSAASGLAERCRDCQRRAELLDLEREAVQKEAQMKKKAWQESEQEASHLSNQLASLEQQQAKSALTRSSIREQEANARSEEVEASDLLVERTDLQQRLRKHQEMIQLRQLLLEERMLLEKRKMSSGEMLREISELEEQADDVERNAQRCVADLRTSLERLAQRCEDARKAKDQAEDWLGAVWAALNQQRREQMLLHRRVKEEDQWASRLQERTDTLVDELGVLEREALTPRAISSAASEETVRTLALLQQRRKNLRRDLSVQLALCRQMQGKVKEAEGEQALLLEQLRPLQPMLALPKT